MRYIATQKSLLPPIEQFQNPNDAEDYFFKEIKRQILLGMIDKLPFKIEKTPTPIGDEIEVKLDVIIKDTKEEIDKLING